MFLCTGDALEMIISCAENPTSLESQLRFLGLRHVTYNVQPHHIPLMGPPLLSVLAELLGTDWTPEVEKAWTSLFDVISETMATAIREGKQQGETVKEMIAAIGSLDAKSQARLGYIISRELASNSPVLFELMQQGMNACDKGEAATATRRVSPTQGENASNIFFEMRASPGRTTSSEATNAATQSSPKTEFFTKARTPTIASIESPKIDGGPPSKHEASGAAKSRWTAALSAVRAVQGMRSAPKSAAPGDDDKTRNGEEPPQLSRTASGCPSETQMPHVENVKWRTALSAVKAAKNMQRMAAARNVQQPEEDHSADCLGLELWTFVVATIDLLYVPQRQRELIFKHASSFFLRGMRSEHLEQVGAAIGAVFRHLLPFHLYGDLQKVAWDWFWNIISMTLGHELDVLEKNCNQRVVDSWALITERTNADTLGKIFWQRLNEIAPDQTHIFRYHHEMHARMHSLQAVSCPSHHIIACPLGPLLRPPCCAGDR